MGSLVEVDHSYELGDALCAKSFLESHDIPTLFLNQHHATIQNIFIVVALGGYRLAVFDSDYNEAKDLLRAASRGEMQLEPGAEGVPS